MAQPNEIHKPDYSRYEAMKKVLQGKSLSPEQYQDAIKKLAKECGV